MDITIVVYNGIDLWDLAIPYEFFRHITNVNIQIVSNSESEILCKDKNLVIGGFDDIKNIEKTDILWICFGESSIQELLKDNRFKLDISRLALSAKKVVTIGGASALLTGGALEKNDEVSSNPAFARTLKKEGIKYIPNLMNETEKIISISSRSVVILTVFKLIGDLFSEELRDQLFKKLRLEKNIILPKEIIDVKIRNKHLKKLFKQNLKRGFDKLALKMTVDSTEDTYAFYIQEDFNVLSFSILYSIISNYQKITTYIVADSKSNFYVEGKGFYIKAKHSLYQIKRVHTLVLSGGYVIEKRLSDNFLKFWIAELTPKTSRVISLDGADRLLGVSGALLDYDPIYDNNDVDNEEGKFVFIEGPGRAINFIYNKIENLTNPSQAILYKSEYFL